MTGVNDRKLLSQPACTAPTVACSNQNNEREQAFERWKIKSSGAVESIFPEGYLIGWGGLLKAGYASLKGLFVAEEVATASRGVNLVYHSVNAEGKTIYVGITNNLERRAAEHLSSKGISIDAIPGLRNLSRADAKAVEQVLIETHGLRKNGGTLINKINSIATTNPAYAGALQRGAELLKNAGYPGF